MAGYGKRPDGSEKGQGWLGPLQLPDTEDVATEYSIGVNIDGKETLIPSLVPTLTEQEIKDVLEAAKTGRMPHGGIVQKAVEHARKRLSQGQSPFKD